MTKNNSAGSELNLSYSMYELRLKTRVISESLLFIYLSIHFILSVPQVRTSVFLYLSAKPDAVHGAEPSSYKPPSSV